MTRRVAIYARVSTPNQTRTETIEQQIEQLQTHVKKKSWQLKPEHIYRDDGRSGAILERPGLDQLRDTVRMAEIDCILITTPDRLARNYVHQMILLDEFERYHCEVEFLDRPMSTDPHDRLLLQIRSAVAEYERTLVTDRIRRGRLAKYRAGTLLPWTRPPYAYRVDPDNPRDPSGVRIEESEAAIVQLIYDWYSQEGGSLCGLSKHLQEVSIPTPSGKQIWGLATLRAILKQPAYTGKVYACRFRYREPSIRRSATHLIGTPHQSYEERPPEEWIFVAEIPAIIEPEQYKIVQAKLVKNKSFAKRNNKSHDYLLRALVSCGLCQKACTARALEKGKYRYYVCSGKAKAIHSHRLEKCPSRFAPAQQLDEIVWQDLCDVLQHPESLTQALERVHSGHWLPQELQARRENLSQAHKRMVNQLERLTEAYLNEVIPLAEYQRRRKEIEKKQEGLQNQEKLLDTQVEQRTHLSQLSASIETFCEKVRDGVEQATFEQKRQLVELLIDRVIVTNDKVEIRYVIPTTPESENVRFCHLRSDYRLHPYPSAKRLDVLGCYSRLVFTLCG